MPKRPSRYHHSKAGALSRGEAAECAVNHGDGAAAAWSQKRRRRGAARGQEAGADGSVAGSWRQAVSASAARDKAAVRGSQAPWPEGTRRASDVPVEERGHGARRRRRRRSGLQRLGFAGAGTDGGRSPPYPESVGPRWPTCVFSGAHMLLGTPCAAPSLEGRLPVHQLQHESQGKMDGWYQPRAKRVAIAAYIFRKRRCCQGGPTRKRNQEEEANHHHHHLLLPSSSIAHRLPHRDGGPGGSG